MAFDLQGKTALITGGGRGIGKAIALTLAEQGVNIALCGRTAETLEETAAAIRAEGVEAWPIVADVSKLENIQDFVRQAVTAADRADILINNAVASQSAPFDEQTDEHWQYHIDVKLMAYIRCARQVLPYMKAQGWGRIVNIGGMTARITAPLRVTNGIVNAGVANFTKQFSAHVAAHNITVNCVHPGTTATDRMLQGFARQARDAEVTVDEIEARQIASIPLGRLIQPRDIANAALFFCSPMADIITGQSIAVDGGSADAVIY
ncbi:MAG: SDR family oxidoreductase [Rhodospirillaceae bacterium]|nr:SDR family oxidoreductase [Rhodospirillaceae bacterium]MBT3494586.1 SDR family oxidoreductase [Rhodospirillaceae bacterium]MBT3782635.1 SDR family oxidoreductase [Rhodospirillaceae bacterium]MBT3974892.1 SDR family oxidoreductase [Rhodospirillaceae bacterium]MBT4171422.1 SDR family oxidoreductase [Rhodospirillaceae bacterium]